MANRRSVCRLVKEDLKNITYRKWFYEKGDKDEIFQRGCDSRTEFSV